MLTNGVTAQSLHNRSSAVRTKIHCGHVLRSRSTQSDFIRLNSTTRSSGLLSLKRVEDQHAAVSVFVGMDVDENEMPEHDAHGGIGFFAHLTIPFAVP